MNKAKPINARTLRIILSILLVLVIGLGIAGFLAARNFLVQKSLDTAQTLADSEYAKKNVRSLSAAAQFINQHEEVEATAKNMVSESRSYVYQDKIIEDIIAIASRSGVTIESIDFTADAQAAGAATPGNASTPAPSGLKQTNVVIALANPTRYDRLLNFIHAIEENKLKMRISKIGMTNTQQQSDGHANVSSDVFTIGVYIK